MSHEALHFLRPDELADGSDYAAHREYRVWSAAVLDGLRQRSKLNSFDRLTSDLSDEVEILV